MALKRRDLLLAGSAGLAAAALLPAASAGAEDEDLALVAALIGKTPTQSDRLRLDMPAEFPTGYTVPMTIEVDSAMTDLDHVRQVRVFAPKNPLIEVVGFRFAPGRSVARVSTRIRLSGPQHVVAVAEMSDGAFLMTRTRGNVASNGCA